MHIVTTRSHLVSTFIYHPEKPSVFWMHNLCTFFKLLHKSLIITTVRCRVLHKYLQMRTRPEDELNKQSYCIRCYSKWLLGQIDRSLQPPCACIDRPDGDEQAANDWDRLTHASPSLSSYSSWTTGRVWRCHPRYGTNKTRRKRHRWIADKCVFYGRSTVGLLSMLTHIIIY